MYFSSFHSIKETIRLFKFLGGLLEHRNDLYLSELKDELLRVCGVDVSDKTVWESLCRSGFTMKQVLRYSNNIDVALNLF